jgi:small subunit ribosomal protein S24e
MKIEIQLKTNNPLFKRTEVHFIIHHDGESVPKRDFIKSELAGILNAKKENIMINYMKSSFGTATTKGYAKVYTSLKDAKAYEKDHILVRNGAVEKVKKPAKEEKPSEEPQKPTEAAGEKPVEEKKEEQNLVSEEAPEKPIEEKPKETDQKDKIDTKDSKPTSDEEKKEST